MTFDKYVEILADFQENKDFKIRKGKAKAISKKELNKNYYQYVNKTELSRDFDIALEERINKPLKEGLICGKHSSKQGGFEDRKLRLDKLEIVRNNPFLYIGPTHFYEQLDTCLSTVRNKKLFDYFIKQGIQNFNDEHAYFADAIGVSALVETSEGYILSFQRSEKSLEYKSYWHLVAGYVDTDFKFFEEKEPSDHFKKLIDKTLLNELNEEGGLVPSQIQRLGVVRDLLGVNFAYLAKINKDFGAVLNSIKNAKDFSEHSSVQKFKLKELVDFLINEQRIVPIAFGGLLLYLKNKDKQLYKRVINETKYIRIKQK